MDISKYSINVTFKGSLQNLPQYGLNHLLLSGLYSVRYLTTGTEGQSNAGNWMVQWKLDNGLTRITSDFEPIMRWSQLTDSN